MFDVIDGIGRYLTNGEETALYFMDGSCNHCIVKKITEYNKIFLGILTIKAMLLKINVITFDDSLEITGISLNLISYARSDFFLPSKVRRVFNIVDPVRSSRLPRVHCDKKNKFISIIGKNSIVNNYPLEIVFQNNHQIRFNIRETTRIIGKFGCPSNKKLKTVIFPSSIEIIDNYAFEYCCNLCSIVFKEKSHLKEIGSNAFSKTSLKKIRFPSSLVKIDNYAFYECKKLSCITLPRDSKIILIGDNSFAYAIIEEISFPPSIVSIGYEAFKDCERLNNIKFDEKSILVNIRFEAFRGCPVNKRSYFNKDYVRLYSRIIS